MSKNYLGGGIGKKNTCDFLDEEAQVPFYQNETFNVAMMMSRGRVHTHQEIMDDVDLHHPMLPDSADDKHLHETIMGADNLDGVRNHIQDVLESHQEVAKKTGDYYLANHLNAKYGWAIGHKAKMETQYPEPSDYFIPEEHIHKHTDKYTFLNGRVLQHKAIGSYHELGKDGEVTPISNAHTGMFNNQPPFMDDNHYATLNFHNKNLTDLHKSHVAANIEPVKHYTGDSSEINQIRAAKNRNKPEPDDLYDPKKATESGDHLRRTIDAAPKYEHPLTVYTGLTRSSDPSKGENHGEAHNVSEFPAFTSTSIDPTNADNFGSNNALRKKTFKDPKIKQVVGDVMSLKIPAGTGHGIYVEPHTETKGEYEYILKDNTKVAHDPKPQYYARGGVIMRHWNGKVID